MSQHVAVPSSSYRWSAGLAYFVGLYAVGALWLSPHSFANLGQIYAEKFLVGVPILLLGGVCTAALVFGRDAPIRYSIETVRQKFPRSLPVLLFFLAGMTAFSTYKTMIPDIVPFYADRWLADIDERLHGKAPWELAHYFHSDIMGLFIFKSYEVLWFVQWFGTVLFVGMFLTGAARIRYLWALSLTIAIVGTVLATGLSSVGPIYYDHFLGGDRFSGMQAAMAALKHSYIVRDYSAYLLALQSSGNAGLGGGISAMPSVHVALVTLNAWFLSSLDRRLGALGWCFAVLIAFGSVYTGWHYAVDGYVSIILTSAIWWATGRFIRADNETITEDVRAEPVSAA